MNHDLPKIHSHFTNSVKEIDQAELLQKSANFKTGKSDIKNDKISSQLEVRSNIQLVILFLNLCMLSTKNRWGVGEGRVFPHFEELINAC